jgi:23S rRNA pseudouridine2605 synthase
MRLNKYIAASTDLSRRAADSAIADGRVAINGVIAKQGQDVSDGDSIFLDSKLVTPQLETVTIMLNKPIGYVVSRDGQGSETIYSILPSEYQRLNPVGRLDKYSSGLLLLSNDGNLAQELTHPSRQKVKVYQVKLDTPLQPLHHQMISDVGIQLDDGLSKFGLSRVQESNDKRWTVTMHEGRNRQIRRTFSALGYDIRTLHRLQFGEYTLGDLKAGHTKKV